MITFIYSIFAIFIVWFLCLIFFIKKEFRIYSILTFVFFSVFCYFALSQLVGLPKPIGYGIPFYTHAFFTKDNVATVVGWAITDKEIYLIIDEDGQKRMYMYHNTPDFLAELTNAYNQHQGFGFGVAFTDTYYTGDVGTHVDLGQFQQNNHISKEPTSKDNVDQYDIQ